MRKLYFLYVFYLLLTIDQIVPESNTYKYHKKMIISVPVADIRATPETMPDSIKLPTTMYSNPLQFSQLLLGEQIIANKEIITKNSEKWLEINAPQQERYTKKLGWHGFPGFIKASQAIEVDNFQKYNLVVKNMLAKLFNENEEILYSISIGTRLSGNKQLNNFWKIALPNGDNALISNDDVNEIDKQINDSIKVIRNNIVKTAKKFLGNLYSWGGRSAQNNDWKMSSVDCSSLIQLSFLANGFQIPRNANGQFLKSNKIKFGKDLRPGDLVFFDPVDRIKDHKTNMTHVLLYIGNENLLECTSSGEQNVRIINFEKRIGFKRQTTIAGDISKNVTTLGKIGNQYHIYFGSYCNDSRALQILQTNALDS